MNMIFHSHNFTDKPIKLITMCLWQMLVPSSGSIFYSIRIESLSFTITGADIEGNTNFLMIFSYGNAL